MSAARACAEQARAASAAALLAVGGGSVIDTAKAANILLSEGGDLVEDYSGAGTLTRPLKPLVAVPTTAGTGSEVTQVAVILDAAGHTKLAFTDRFLLPSLAILDPELTLSLPPGFTAGTAMDAMTHAVEAYVGTQASPFADALAYEAVRLITAHVERACRDGADLEARGALLIASCMAGMAFTHSMVGCVHGMAHSVGGICGVPHGAANAILLPFGLEYNFDFISEKLARMAPALGVSRAAAEAAAVAPAGGNRSTETARQIIAAIRALTARLHEVAGLPVTLHEAGVPEGVLPAVAEATVMDGTSFYNPREVEAAAILEKLREAY